jgi:hypothetical protein
MRADGELPHELAIVELLLRVWPRAPQHRPAERLLEVGDGLHRHGVDHLLVELRVAFRRRPAVLREQAGRVQVHR